MILEKRDVMKSALQVWNEKLIPALLEYWDQSSGKTATLFVQARNDFEGYDACVYSHTRTEKCPSLMLVDVQNNERLSPIIVMCATACVADVSMDANLGSLSQGDIFARYE